MTREYLIRLPWPDKALSPNSRRDRRHTTDKRRAYRDAGFYACKEAGAVIPHDAHLEVSFHPPDRRRRDLDNMLGAIKYGLDGIALGAGVDDNGWSLSIRKADPVKGGAVLVHVRPSLAQVELRGVVT